MNFLKYFLERIHHSLENWIPLSIPQPLPNRMSLTSTDLTHAIAYTHSDYVNKDPISFWVEFPQTDQTKMKTKPHG